jgi:phospholipid N-methyltransferase
MAGSSFFREFLSNWQTTGAIAPSSPSLAREIALCAGVSAARNIIELGPGTGALTDAIAGTKPSGAAYMGIEINAGFVGELRQRHPSLNFTHGAAQDFDFAGYLANSPPLDCIISGLPWAAFPPSLQEAILKPVVQHLPRGARFVTFAYAGPHLLTKGRHFRGMLEQHFCQVGRSDMVWNNLPPAFVYVASH